MDDSFRELFSLRWYLQVREASMRAPHRATAVLLNGTGEADTPTIVRCMLAPFRFFLSKLRAYLLMNGTLLYTGQHLFLVEQTKNDV